jgi:hypothetical protein
MAARRFVETIWPTDIWRTYIWPTYIWQRHGHQLIHQKVYSTLYAYRPNVCRTKVFGPNDMEPTF